MSPFRSRTDGSHYPLTKRRRGLYSAPHHEKYSEILSGIHTQNDAEEASRTMLGEFHGAKERQKQVRVKRSLVQRANRARVASTNKNLSPEVREREGKIAEVFYRAEKQMVIPPKDPPKIAKSSHSDYKMMYLTDLRKERKYAKAHGESTKEIDAELVKRAQDRSMHKISKGEVKAEKAMVKDERTGETEYLKMAAEAEKEGRHQDAKIFREHAHDEAQHGKEDAKILKDSQRKPQWEWEHDGYHVVSAEEAKKHPELYG